jgi:CubicO group peptidase (beta-lactamase class C family)
MEDHSAQQASHFLPVQALLEAAIVDGAFPGAAWGVAQHGVVRALGAAGGFTYEPDSPRVTPGTVYDLASVSKVVANTAMAMLLYQRGMLDLDLRLGDLLPGFVIAGERGSGRHRVSIRLLLAHASGLPGYAPLFLEHPDRAGLLRACLHLPLTAEPGTRAEYSDIGFILLGKALEVLSGEPLDRFCAREIFSPLGMTRTAYNPAPASRAAIPPTELDELFRRRVVQGEVHDENCYVLGGCAGHAGLFAPVGDLLRFAEAVLAPLRPETPPTAALFQANTVHLFTSRSGLPPGSSRALGWDTPSGTPSSSGSYFGHLSFGHLGYTGTSLWIDPTRDLSVVLMTNRTWPVRENKMIQQVRPAFHDLVSKLL